MIIPSVILEERKHDLPRINLGLTYDQVTKTCEKIAKKMEAKKAKATYTPKKLIFNYPATIVFWEDGTKTVVKCSENEEFDRYHGFCAALAKKIFENNSQIHKIVKSGEESIESLVERKGGEVKCRKKSR